MKMFLSAIVLSLAFTSTMAHALEGSAVINRDGTIGIMQVGGDCPPQPTSEDMKTMSTCNPGTNECPANYEEQAKYCWGGWSRGFYHCGTICRAPIEHEGNGGKRDGGGHRGGHDGHEDHGRD
ncbi:hypothetical protein [Bdellovibrio svalbardensis]|uniref:Uncharacterized protein n=1 Tax=Bdellovibrio svalbardensis TaxID=2972972 RepID=A0ABT6DKC1_9BACT|nr:hypothetical protein [Bdellovibrio svalbardensis]MDG0816286.1 hypothetical protein [Bdellovibrio svalbardensis]